MTTPTPPTLSNPAPRKKRLLKWVLIAAGGGVVVLGLGILLLPTLLSTGPGKSFVLGQVNSLLKGRIEIDSWSLGWFSPLSLTGLKVYDDQNRLAVAVPSVTTGLTVLSAARGNLDLGETVIDSPNLVLFEVRKDGTDNLSTLVGPSDPDAKIVIPDFKGNITIKSLTATIQGDRIGSPIRIDPSDLSVRIPSLANAPVTTDLKLVVRRDNSPPGSPPGIITVKGDAQAIFGGAIDAAKLTANQTVTLSGVDLGAVSPFLAASGVTLAGMADGDIVAKVLGLDAAEIDGDLRVRNLVVAGPALKGDTFGTALLSVPIKLSTTKDADGTPRLRIEKLGIESAELTAAVTGDVSQGALQRLGEMKPPNSAGQIKLDVRIPDLGVVATQLRNTLALGPDVTVTAGTLINAVDIQIAPAAATLKGTTRIEGVRGTNAGKPVSLDPIAADYDLRADFADAGLKSLNITAANLTSAFATASVKGTLSDLAYSADVDLGRMRAQLGQFVDFGAADFAGRMVSTGSLKGDLLAAAGDVVAISRTELTGVRIVTPATSTSAGMNLDIDRLLADGETLLKSKGEKRVGIAEVRRLLVEAGPAGSPLMVVDATATADLGTSDVPAFDVKRLDIASLPEAQRRYGGLVPALAEMKLQFPTGAVRANLAGSFVGGTLVTSRPISAALIDLSVVRGGRPVVTRDSITLALAGTIATAPNLRAELSQLDLTSTSKLIQARQLGDKLLVEVRSDGSAGGTGGVTFSADLAAAARASAAWSGTPQQQEVRSGLAAGQVTLSDTGNGPSTVAAKVNLTALTVGSTLSNESVSVDLSASSPDRFKTLAATADVGSAFATLQLRDAAISLAAPGFWEMLTSANLTAKSDDLAKVDALLKALSPPVAAAPNTSPNTPAKPPVSLTSGTLAADLRISRQGTTTTVNIASLQAGNLSLQSGSASYRVPKDVNVRGQLTIDAFTTPNTTTAAQIRQLSINELVGSLGVADMVVSQPIVVTDLASTSPAVKGAVQLSGRIQTVTGLLEVLQGAAPGSIYPYVGDFAVEQQLATNQGQSSAAGKVMVSNLKLLDPRGNPTFSEDRLEIVNDVSFSAAADGELRIRNLAITAASSNAISLRATGVVKDMAGARTITEPVRLNVGYDLDKLFPLIVPMLSAETRASMAGAVVSGKYDREFVITGSYPATVAPEVAIRTLSVTGGLGVASARIPAYGLDLSKFEPGVVLKDGIATLSMASPAGLNGGTLNLSGAAVNLGETTPRLSTPDNLVMIDNIAINKVVADKLGKFLGPLFVNTDKATGQLRVTFVKCTRFPLGELMNDRGPANDGFAEVTLNIVDLELLGGFAGSIVRDIGGLGQVFVGNVKDARFVAKNGVVSQELPIALGKGVTADIRFSGNIELAPPQRLVPLQVRVGSALLRNRIPLIREGIQLADPVFVITGTVSQPRLDLAKGIQQWIRDQAGGILPGLLGGQRGGSPAPPATPGAASTQQAPTPVQDALGSLLQGLGGNKEKNEKKSGPK